MKRLKITRPFERTGASVVSSWETQIQPSKFLRRSALVRKLQLRLHSSPAHRWPSVSAQQFSKFSRKESPMKLPKPVKIKTHTKPPEVGHPAVFRAVTRALVFKYKNTPQKRKP